MKIDCLLLLYLLHFAQCNPNPQTNLDKLIDNVFNTDYNSSPNSTDPGQTDEIGVICETGTECVAYYLCKDNQIVRDGAGVIDIRIDDESDENAPKKCTYLDTCCALGDKTTEPIHRTPITPPQQMGCGKRNTDGVGFKITGDKANESEYGEFPWMVAILKIEEVLKEILNIYLCGGSLITPSVVITAAHCVSNKQIKDLKVRAGEWDTQTKKEIYMDQDRDLSDIVVHENFYKGGLFNDIALLFMATPFVLQENIQPICLPPPNTNFDHLRCYATGWGKDTFGQSGQYQVILKKIDLPVVPHRECENILRTSRLGKHFELDDSLMCAGGEIGKDTCKGDGGSPLVCPIPNTVDRYYQAGIVAYGIGCGEKYPGVYASISYLRTWIDKVLEMKAISNKDFTHIA